jgi:hypothetical protein
MMDKHVLFDPVLKELKDQIELEAEEKMRAAGVDIDAAKQRAGR